MDGENEDTQTEETPEPEVKTSELLEPAEGAIEKVAEVISKPKSVLIPEVATPEPEVTPEPEAVLEPKPVALVKVPAVQEPAGMLDIFPDEGVSPISDGNLSNLNVFPDKLSLF